MRATRLIGLVVAAVVAALVVPTAASAEGDGHGGGDAPTYTVTITNLTEAQYLTPPNWAAHDRSVDVFQRGRPASAGVQAVAENGGVPVLAAELQGAVDDAGAGVSGVGGDGPISPGSSATFEFTTDERFFSLVSMVVCTNDGFAGIDSRRLPGQDGGTRTFHVRALDAGTEINTEMRADLVPAPFCGEGEGSGESNPELAENGVIRLHRTLKGVGDLDPALDWRGPVAEVTIERNDPVPTFTVEIENLTDGQYLTPPNFAIHDRSVGVFQPGRPASAGVQAVAENGGVPVLAAELQGAVDDAGVGVSGVGGDGPIGPGGNAVFEVTGDYTRFSLVSMVVCTNDGFAGIDAKRVPRQSGESRTFYVQAYDAGTEINTEMRADLVPAPFCGDGEGSGETNPELAENGVIRVHRTLQGVGDLDPALDWSGPVAKVTVTRH